MDRKSEHLKKLSAARERLLSECLNLVALSRPREHRREVDEGLIAVQNTIDAIDLVLGGKTPIASGKLLSFPTRTLHQPAMTTNENSPLRGTQVQLRTRKVSRF